MKMIKIISGAVLGLGIINATFAAPTPEDRKALCDKHPDKYVWVAKTQTCIPINPCETTNMQVKDTYCIEVNLQYKYNYLMTNMYKDIVQRYLKNVLSLNVDTIEYKSPKDIFEEVDNDFFYVRTLDGGYYVVSIPRNPQDRLTDEERMIRTACAVYNGKYDWAVVDQPRSDKVVMGQCNLKQQSLCSDVADYASRLFDKHGCRGSIHNLSSSNSDYCLIVCTFDE